MGIESGMTKTQFFALVQAVEVRSTNLKSACHGPQHWRCVSHVGLQLASSVDGADPLVALLFGLFHDAMRVNDDHDPQHGLRGAKLAIELHERGHFKLDPHALDALLHACEHHTDQRLGPTPTTQICYDADRLNLWRVFVKPNPAYLNTEVAKGMIGATEALHWTPITWDEVYEGYAARKK